MWLDAIEATGGWLSDGRTPCVYIFSRAVMDCTALPYKTRSSSHWPRRQLSSIFMFWRLVDSRELKSAARRSDRGSGISFSIVRTGRDELCQQEHYVPNAMARGLLRVSPVVALAVGPSQASSSVSASSATEPPDTAATFAAARQKLNRKH